MSSDMLKRLHSDCVGGIPPQLIHIVPSKEGLSQELRENLDFLRRSNPNWRQIIFSDQEALEFVKKHYGARYCDALLRIDPAYGPARSDLMRYLLVYRLGGVYLDTKSGANRPLSEIIRNDDEFLVCQWDNGLGGQHQGVGFHPELSHVTGGEYENWVIASRSEHPFLWEVISAVVNNIENYSVKGFGVGKNGVLRLTGPIAYTLAIHRVLAAHKHRMVICAQAGFVYASSGNSQRHVLAHKLHYSRLLHPIVTPQHETKVSQWLYLGERWILLKIAALKHWNRKRINAHRVSKGVGLR